MEIKKILVPTDGSEDSKKALNVAKQMAEKFNAQVVLLNAVKPFHDYYFEDTHKHSVLLDMEVMKRKSADLLEKMKEELKGLDVRTVSVVGNPADQIITTAKEEAVDLIIMATHGMSMMKRYLIGSVTNNVVHHSTIPVLVIP